MKTKPFQKMDHPSIQNQNIQNESETLNSSSFEIKRSDFQYDTITGQLLNEDQKNFQYCSIVIIIINYYSLMNILQIILMMFVQRIISRTRYSL